MYGKHDTPQSEDELCILYLYNVQSYIMKRVKQTLYL